MSEKFQSENWSKQVLSANILPEISYFQNRLNQQQFVHVVG